MTADAANPQFTIYVHQGPNPWKVVIFLEELGLSYKMVPVNSKNDEQKKAPYININPNGRMPALIDHHNNDFTIWESGAIILYLVEKYDTQKKISFDKFEDEAIAKQWLMFQMSGQGPYWGQLAHFSFYHPVKVPTAIERYENEIRRTIGVLDTVLEGKKWLVGEKASYADLSFLPWFMLLDMEIGVIHEEWKEVTEGKGGKWQNVIAWIARMKERESVKAMQTKRTSI